MLQSESMYVSCFNKITRLYYVNKSSKPASVDVHEGDDISYQINLPSWADILDVYFNVHNDKTFVSIIKDNNIMIMIIDMITNMTGIITTTTHWPVFPQFIAVINKCLVIKNSLDKLCYRLTYHSKGWCINADKMISDVYTTSLDNTYNVISWSYQNYIYFLSCEGTITAVNMKTKCSQQIRHDIADQFIFTKDIVMICKDSLYVAVEGKLLKLYSHSERVDHIMTLDNDMIYEMPVVWHDDNEGMVRYFDGSKVLKLENRVMTIE
jgi:hypothetical protein